MTNRRKADLIRLRNAFDVDRNSFRSPIDGQVYILKQNIGCVDCVLGGPFGACSSHWQHLIQISCPAGNGVAFSRPTAEYVLESL